LPVPGSTRLKTAECPAGCLDFVTEKKGRAIAPFSFSGVEAIAVVKGADKVNSKRLPAVDRSSSIAPARKFMPAA
jgi:hypothetical protein